MFSQMCENGITAVSPVHWHSPNYLLAPKWEDDTTTDPQMCYTRLSIPCMCNRALGYNFVCAKSQELIHIQYSRLMPPLLRTMRANQNATYVFTRKLPALIVCDEYPTAVHNSKLICNSTFKITGKQCCNSQLRHDLLHLLVW